MRRVGLTVLLICVGCDQVFDLDPVDTIVACEPELVANLDADGDGVLNDVDACPHVANHEVNDEDSDGVPDACDLCPQLPDAAAGADPECDGIGAACDPDSEIVHDRRFFGFGSAAGLSLRDATLEGGRVRFELTATDTSGEIVVDQAAGPAASYQFAGTIENAMVPQYYSLGLVLVTGSTEYELRLRKQSTHELSLAIHQETTDTTLASTPAGSVTSTQLPFTLRVTTDTSSLAASLTVAGRSITAEAAATLVAPVRFSVNGYRDTDASVTTILIEQLEYTTVRP